MPQRRERVLHEEAIARQEPGVVQTEAVAQILLHVLAVRRIEAHAAQMERNLRRYPIAVQAARNYRVLRKRGVTVRRKIDMIIGTFCISGGHALLHDDRDFEPMVAHLGLRTVPV